MPGASRALRAGDLPALLAIQQACYGAAYIESAQVYARRLASPVNCSRVWERDGQVCAYLAAYRSLLGKVTPLHGDFGVPHGAADTLYVHDMAVLPSCAGQGIARALLESVWEEGRAAGLRHSALVSVQDSRAYWERCGYDARAPSGQADLARLASYGDGAIYMVRELDLAG
ncbi:GNAT family N-acetyltransferase [Pseudoduganella lutea]|uniref:GNAT family N-acetyltransferase n=1 Tax=Pseudoduganella lutea TaxID=321985 RepID=A0A4P6L735_9BURK|nr:GNAT family N-acetyltransferase [Pseudoduganella lutea]